MRLRNNIFAAAFDYLKREKGIKTQKRLAELMGVSEDTITRILKDRCEVTEDIITKLQTASGCIFNLQWLRGEDPNHMLVEDLDDGMPTEDNGRDIHIDQSSLVNALLAAKDQLIEELQNKYEAMEREKDERINELKELAEERLHRIAELRRIIDSNNISITDYPFPVGAAEKHNQKHI
jgi:plasmid maintenance system antidote protein VapI